MKLGADPELFLMDREGNYISGHGYIKGTKEQPFKVKEGATQLDGVAAEFNIDPCSTEDEWLMRLDTVQSILHGQIGTDQKLVADPVAYFTPEYFNKLPDEIKVLGCTPDFNAYTCEQNIPPVTSEPFRTGSGHIHVGDYVVEEGVDYLQDVRNRVKQLDAVLFLSSLLWDKDKKRRELYGKPGAFRPKTYGFEYRPLSNRWVGDVELQKWVFNATISAMDLYSKGFGLWEEEAPEEGYEHSTLVQYHKLLNKEYGVPLLPEKWLEG